MRAAVLERPLVLHVGFLRLPILSCPSTQTARSSLTLGAVSQFSIGEGTHRDNVAGSSPLPAESVNVREAVRRAISTLTVMGRPEDKAVCVQMERPRTKLAVGMGIHKLRAA
jgi:hypothetical protein